MTYITSYLSDIIIVFILLTIMVSIMGLALLSVLTSIDSNLKKIAYRLKDKK